MWMDSSPDTGARSTALIYSKAGEALQHDSEDHALET